MNHILYIPIVHSKENYIVTASSFKLNPESNKANLYY